MGFLETWGHLRILQRGYIINLEIDHIPVGSKIKTQKDSVVELDYVPVTAAIQSMGPVNLPIYLEVIL